MIMLKTYNKENNTYSRYFHVSEIEAVQLLIDHGIDVNWLNSRFETPLMMALNQIEIEVADL